MTLSPPADSGRPIVLDYGDPAAEYEAIRSGALLVDHGDRELWLFQGATARETLTGLVTNDVLALTPGHGLYAAALTPKGRIVTDLRILALADASIAPDSPPTMKRPTLAAVSATPPAPSDWPTGAALLVDVPAAASAGWGDVVRKYVNPRLAAYRRVTDRVAAFGVYGPRARDALAESFALAPSAFAALPPYGHATVETAGDALVVTRIPDLGVDGFVVYAGGDGHAAAWSRLHRAGVAVPGGQRAYDTARIESGRPTWGVDIDETTIPQEANFDELHAISYTKGCYTGQEVVARVHFRGHVNRHLRGLAYEAEGGPLEIGSRLLDETGRDVGDVRSVAVSPRLGGIALGMVRREVEPGTTLVVRSGEGEAAPLDRRAVLYALPFPE